MATRQVQLGGQTPSHGARHLGRRPAPFLKWAGGKGQLLNQMQPYFPKEFGAYYEPFLGGGAVFFHLLPTRAILSDSNEELINGYRVIRDQPLQLAAALEEHAPHGSSEAYFKRLRSLNPASLSHVDRAARLIFLNKTCFNGLYRVNSKGEFNTPFGHYAKPPKLYEPENLHAVSFSLQGKTLAVGDYATACANAKRGDFVYLDPPYHPLARTANFTSYTKKAFTEEDQANLAVLVHELDARGCFVILSNSSHANVRRLYEGRGYRIITLKARRAINCKGDARGAIKEYLVTNIPKRT